MVISISKIKNISVIKKNWILNGSRLMENGSNPHSNGDIFSRLIKYFFDNIIFIYKNIDEIISVSVIIIKRIIYINRLNLLIGS